MERPTERTYARRPHQYGGTDYDRGQCMTLRKLKNDEKLTRLGYIAEFAIDTVLKQCGECGEWFIDEGSRAGHFQTRHQEARELTPMEEDQKLDEDERQINEVAPVFFDKTKATREANEAIELSGENEILKAENARLKKLLNKKEPPKSVKKTAARKSAKKKPAKGKPASRKRSA